MAAWRMAFRAGTNGDEMWPFCQRMGVAAIGHEALVDIDLSKYPEGEPKARWSQHSSPQRASLKRFVSQMEQGDVIYVKQGPYIVGNGVVAGSYRFKKESQIRERGGDIWQHTRRVRWVPGFPSVRMQLGQQQAVTVVSLTDEQVETVEQAARACFAEESDIEGIKTEAGSFRTKRSRRLRNRAFDDAHGICSVCGRDYSKVLGGWGVRVLQVHHRRQLSARTAPSITKVGDLAVVCANCHLLLHLDPESALSVEQLREMIQADGILNYV